MTQPDLEQKAAAGEPFSASDAERVLASPDLTNVGHLAELARRKASGDIITFGRVLEIEGGAFPASPGDAGEIRLRGPVTSIDEAVDLVSRARAFGGPRPLTAFAFANLFDVCGRSAETLVAAARRLREAGLDAASECALDAFADAAEATSAVQALERGGVGVWRLTVDRAPLEERLRLIQWAAALREAAPAIQAFAPLPRRDPADQPATGYDDVRTVAAARLVCPMIRHIQVDWPLYGPKLAQVALLYGANDVDGIAAMDTSGLGARRSPLEDVRRQIRAAAAEPIERNGRYERLS